MKYENLAKLLEAIKSENNSDSILEFLSTGKLKIEVLPEFYYDAELIEPGIDVFSVKFENGDELSYRTESVKEENASTQEELTSNGQPLDMDAEKLIMPLIRAAYEKARIYYTGERCLQLFLDILTNRISDYPRMNCFRDFKVNLNFIEGTPDVMVNYEDNNNTQTLRISFDRYNINYIEIKIDSSGAYITSNVKPRNGKKLGPVSVEIAQEIIDTVIDQNDERHLHKG